MWVSSSLAPYLNQRTSALFASHILGPSTTPSTHIHKPHQQFSPGGRNQLTQIIVRMLVVKGNTHQRSKLDSHVKIDSSIENNFQREGRGKIKTPNSTEEVESRVRDRTSLCKCGGFHLSYFRASSISLEAASRPLFKGGNCGLKQ